jgi:hypothetical protein
MPVKGFHASAWVKHNRSQRGNLRLAAAANVPATILTSSSWLTARSPVCILSFYGRRHREHPTG